MPASTARSNQHGGASATTRVPVWQSTQVDAHVGLVQPRVQILFLRTTEGSRLLRHSLAQDVSKRQTHRGTHDRHAQSVRLSPYTSSAPPVMLTYWFIPVDLLSRAHARRSRSETEPTRSADLYRSSHCKKQIVSRSLPTRCSEHTDACELRHTCREVPFCPRSDGVHNLVAG